MADGPRPGSTRGERRVLAAARAFSAMSGGPVIVGGIGLVELGRAAVAARARRRPPLGAATAGAAALGYFLVVRPWTRRWGATPEEIDATLTGDELVSEPGLAMTRVVTIDVPVEEVWPWLAQIGQDRGGFYSYTWLENLAGCRMRNADRIHPEWQHRDPGEGVPLHPLNAPKLAHFEPERTFAFAGGWYFNLRPIDDGRCRLIARTRVPAGVPSLAYALFVEAPHFIMERKMLLGLKARAESAAVSHPA